MQCILLNAAANQCLWGFSKKLEFSASFHHFPACNVISCVPALPPRLLSHHTCHAAFAFRLSADMREKRVHYYDDGWSCMLSRLEVNCEIPPYTLTKRASDETMMMIMRDLTGINGKTKILSVEKMGK